MFWWENIFHHDYDDDEDTAKDMINISSTSGEALVVGSWNGKAGQDCEVLSLFSSSSNTPSFNIISIIIILE